MNPLYILLGSLTIFTPLGLLSKGTAWGEWGKEEILNMLGYIPKGMNKSTSINAIMSDYSIKNLSETTGYLLSGIIGIILVFLFFILFLSISTIIHIYPTCFILFIFFMQDFNYKLLIFIVYLLSILLCNPSESSAVIGTVNHK